MKTITKFLLTISPAILLSFNSINAQCVASFTWTQPSNNVIFFANTSTPINNFTTFFWNFGDSQSASAFSPTHTYSNAGTYIACVTMIDSLNNCVSQFCDTIVVTGTSCYASFTWAQITNTTTNFTSTSTGVTGTTSYYWDFGDGNYGYIQNPQHIYANNGNYIVCLTISDTATSCQSTYCDSISVISGIHSYEKNTTWTLYPNPATSTITIQSEMSLQGNIFVVSDITGREIISGKINGNSINVNSLESGTYILKIENIKGEFSTQRFIKN